MKTLSILIFGIFSTTTLAQSRSAFEVLFLSNRIEVISPKENGESIGMVMTNKTLRPILLRLEDDKKQVIDYYQVRANRKKAVEFKTYGSKSFDLIPLSPGMQALALRPGNSKYAIPEKN